MSFYEKYDDVSKFYDDGRVPVGGEIYVGFLAAQLNKPLNEVHVLDAGCGTGNYSLFLLDKGVGKMSLFDASEGMLGTAKKKLHNFIETGRVVDARQGYLPKLPHDDNSFDAVMVNFVLHHLEDGTDPEYKKTASVFKEFLRVIKPGGLFMMSTLTHFQFLESLWVSNIMSETGKQKMTARLAPIDMVKKFITDAGFDSPRRYVPVEEKILTDKFYFDFDGLVREEWRAQMSHYALQNEDETQEMLNKMLKMKSEGTWDNYIKHHEDLRLNVGWVTILISTKPK